MQHGTTTLEDSWFLAKLKADLPHNPEIVPLGIYIKELKIISTQEPEHSYL